MNIIEKVKSRPQEASHQATASHMFGGSIPTQNSIVSKSLIRWLSSLKGKYLHAYQSASSEQAGQPKISSLILLKLRL